ncbi:hypothetical protein [Streptomyces sp. G1]|uniref:hypothetical protein n=1 Tax=Streptomyces sp. G1 TaxID=361572 RepID=UPI00202F4175|nr:hypothetical protein [Streptomyces sp. G1]MCM1976504.1 hypothetical protein [Streptomyces sp. G1]
MGIGWRPAPRPGLLGAFGRHRPGRLGSFAVLYGHGRFLDALFADNPVYPAHPDEFTEHLAGLVVEDTAGEGDTGSFFARLSRLPPHADRIVFVVSSFEPATCTTFADLLQAIERHG